MLIIGVGKKNERTLGKAGSYHMSQSVRYTVTQRISKLMAH